MARHILSAFGEGVQVKLALLLAPIQHVGVVVLTLSGYGPCRWSCRGPSDMDWSIDAVPVGDPGLLHLQHSRVVLGRLHAASPRLNSCSFAFVLSKRSGLSRRLLDSIASRLECYVAEYHPMPWLACAALGAAC